MHSPLAPLQPTPPGKVYPQSGTFSNVSVAEEMNPLRRSTMEDVHRVLPVFDGDENLSFLGIYDGHGGTDGMDGWTMKG